MAVSDVKITSDLIDGPSLVMRYTAGGYPESITLDRVVECSNLTVAAQGIGSDAVATALLAVLARYPLLTPDANVPLALVRGLVVPGRAERRLRQLHGELPL